MMMMTTTNLNIAASAYNFTTPTKVSTTAEEATEDRKLVTLLSKKENFQAVDTNKDGVLDVWEVNKFLKNFTARSEKNTGFKDLNGAFTRLQNLQRDLSLAKVGSADKTKDSLEVFGISFTDVKKVDNDFRYWDATNADANKGKGLAVLGQWYAGQYQKTLNNGTSYDGLTSLLNTQQAEYDLPKHVKKATSGSGTSNEKTDTKTETKTEGFNWLNALIAGGTGFLAAWLIKK